ncbi:MAG: cytochrome b N-terminal domain-containing protein, partial [Caldilineaceae bacterium]|nr:cytochrome b N-terminal domain-containing protein [Caldilineaceae bacterium]
MKGDLLPRFWFQRLWSVIDDRMGISALVGPILHHPVPPDAKWAYVFGSATLTAFLVQVITGIGLATTYVSSAGEAYQSLQFITNEAWFGNLLRGMHFYGASAMVLLVGIHAARTFLYGAYKFPREINWLSGVGLLGLTLVMGFTGQLLRWDQNAIWSVVVGAEQAARAPWVGNALARFLLAGETIGGATLSRFFAFHVFFVPALIFALVGLHLQLVLHNGISEMPRAGQPVDPQTYRAWYQRLLAQEGVPFWPDAAWRDILFGAVVVVAIVLCAAIFGPPPLDKAPDPSVVSAYPRPDWYLLWYFAVLALTPPALENWVILLAPVLGFALLLAIPLLSNRGERAPSRRPWAVGTVGFVVVMIGTLWIAGVQAHWSPDFHPNPLPPAIVGPDQGPIAAGAQLFHERGCQNCHQISGYGGQRGPNLTTVGDRLNRDQLTIRILNGGTNMPPFADVLTPDEVTELVA